MGFLFKPNIKVVTCGGDDYIANITLEDEKEILGDYPWIFDSKSGQIYAYDQNKNTLKPLEIFFDATRVKSLNKKYKPTTINNV